MSENEIKRSRRSSGAITLHDVARLAGVSGVSGRVHFREASAGGGEVLALAFH